MSSVIVLDSAIRQLCYYCASAVLCYFSRNSALSCNTYILLSPGVRPQGLCSRLGTGTQTVRPHTCQKMTNNSQPIFFFVLSSVYILVNIFVICALSHFDDFHYLIPSDRYDKKNVRGTQLWMISSFVVPCGHPRQKKNVGCGSQAKTLTSHCLAVPDLYL